jgi:glucose/arabinose dehydrogenase
VVPVSLPSGFSISTLTTGLAAPTAMEFSPDGRLFVLEQGGNVKLVHNDGTTWTALHLNVDSTNERGLLGIAFDPNYQFNHYVYLYYTNPSPGAATWANNEHNQLSRFTVNDSNPLQPVFTNEAPILDWNNLSSATNHNGGAIHFGLDGMLYADAGDNVQTFTQGGQTYRVSQTLNNLLGKQLRINVAAFNSGLATRDDTTVGHLIPTDNPFVGTATGINQLIYALGLRNPFTFAVQPGTGIIYINDVGENVWEEIDQSFAGGNYGWSGGETDGFGQHPPGPGVYHDPLLAYNHSGGPAGGGQGIIGGSFYDPVTPQFPPSYIGKYFYADLAAGWIRVFDPAHPGNISNPDTSTGFATGLPSGTVGVEVGPNGSLYALSQGGGGVVYVISYRKPASWATDLDGDSKTDFGILDQTIGAFGFSLSKGGSLIESIGNPSHNLIPITGDFNGDGKADPGVFDQATGSFIVDLTGGGVTGAQIGNPSDDLVPAIGDYDGDGKSDFGIYDRTTGYFGIDLSSGGIIIRQVGNPADVNIPVPGDFDGDSKTDLVIFDKTTGTFGGYLSNGGLIGAQIGNPSHDLIPVTGDYDGDHKSDLGVYDRTTGYFGISLSSGSALFARIGNTSDIIIPLMGDYDGDNKSDLAIFDKTTGTFGAILTGGGTLFEHIGNPSHDLRPFNSLFVDYPPPGSPGMALLAQPAPADRPLQDSIWASALEDLAGARRLRRGL